MSKTSRKNYLQTYLDLEDEGTVESWKTSYSDLMTILLVFFVLLISATQISAVKFERIKNAFKGATEKESVAVIMEQLEQKIAEENLSKYISVKTAGSSIEIDFQDHLLFDLGKTKVKAEAKAVIYKIAKLLENLPEYAQLAVEGYTDDNPVNPRVYDSNWQLSVLRSLAVLEVLDESKFCKGNCEVRGFGEYRPTLPNRTEDGSPIAKNQSENRRVVLRIF